MTNKDSSWQIIRGICIIAVVLIHCQTHTAIDGTPDSIFTWCTETSLTFLWLFSFLYPDTLSVFPNYGGVFGSGINQGFAE